MYLFRVAAHGPNDLAGAHVPDAGDGVEAGRGDQGAVAVKWNAYKVIRNKWL